MCHKVTVCETTCVYEVLLDTRHTLASSSGPRRIRTATAGYSRTGIRTQSNRWATRDLGQVGKNVIGYVGSSISGDASTECVSHARERSKIYVTETELSQNTPPAGTLAREKAA